MDLGRSERLLWPRSMANSPQASLRICCRAASVGLARENGAALEGPCPARTVVPHGPSYEGTLGPAGAAKHPSPPDNHGHERTPKPQVGSAARWSLHLPKLAYNDAVTSPAVPSTCPERRHLTVLTVSSGRSDERLTRAVGVASRLDGTTGHCFQARNARSAILRTESCWPLNSFQGLRPRRRMRWTAFLLPGRTAPKGEDRDERSTGRRPGHPQPADPAEGTALRRATGVPPAVHAQLRRGRGQPRRGRDLRAQHRGGGPGLPAKREPLRRRDRGQADLDGAATALAVVLPARLAEQARNRLASMPRPVQPGNRVERCGRAAEEQQTGPVTTVINRQRR